MNAPRSSFALIALAGLAVLALGGCLEDTGGEADTAIADSAVADTVEGDTGVSDTVEVGDTHAVDTDAADTAPPKGTCAARCGEYVATEGCQCDPACAEYGNCCVDYDALCSSGPAATDFLVANDTECAEDADWVQVVHVRDGDTIDLATGDAVRFLVVDTTEISSNDCEAWEAKAFTAAEVAASGDLVCLVKDPTSTDRDLYDRLLRYVYVRDPLADGAAINLNVRLVRLGYARVYYPYAYGRVYEADAKAAQAAAMSEGLGGWGACNW